NGANDNASGVASIIESARLLAGLKVAPKRSVMFVAFFGEERGLLGSRYFVRNPVAPLWQMVANLNLEQTGRTDSSEGPNVGQVNLTGYHFTTIHRHMEAAGEATGLKVVKHERFSDAYFMASDNAALAAVGVPSTTLSVTYAFPDYHQKGDEWEKIDYANMAKVTRGIAQGTYLAAEAAERVSWNEAEDKTKVYREAAAKLVQ
ncbi:MAG: M28 family metallopeptidase, partial [bacterium]